MRMSCSHGQCQSQSQSEAASCKPGCQLELEGHHIRQHDVTVFPPLPSRQFFAKLLRAAAGGRWRRADDTDTGHSAGIDPALVLGCAAIDPRRWASLPSSMAIN